MARKKQSFDFMESEIRGKNLVRLGFNENHVRLLLSKCSATAIDSLFGLASPVWQRLVALLNLDNIVRVFEKSDPKENFDALVAHSEHLRQLGFSAEQIMMMVGYKNGAKNLRAVLTHFDHFMRMGLQRFQIVSLASSSNGYQVLDQFAEQSETLLPQGFTLQQLVLVAGNRTGVTNLIRLAEFSERLLARGFTHQQLANLTACIDGDINICVLAGALPSLATIPFTHEELLRIVSLPSGHRNLTALLENTDLLLKLQMSAQQISKLLGRARGVEFLGLIRLHFDTLQRHGFGVNYFIQLIDYVKFLQPTEAIITNLDCFGQFQLLPDDIIDIFRSGGTTKYFNEFFEHRESLAKINPPKPLLKLMLTGRQSIAKYIENYRETPTLPASIQEPELREDALNTTSGMVELKSSNLSFPMTQERELMLNMGFSAAQVSRVSSSNQFEHILHYLRKELMDPYSCFVRYFDTEQICCLAMKRSWRQSFEHVTKYTDQLINLGFTPLEILSLIDGDGPAKNFRVVLDNFTVLTQHYHLTPAQMSEALRLRGGAGHYEQLVAESLRTNPAAEQAPLVETAPPANQAPPQMLQLRDFGFSMEQSSMLYQKRHGHKIAEELIGILSQSTYLLTILAPHELIAMSCDFGYADNLLALQQFYQPLLTFGFNRHQIISLVSFTGGSRTLAALYNYFKPLSENFQLALPEIYLLARHDGGSRNIIAFINYAERFMQQGFSKAQVVQIVGQLGGSALLECLVKYFAYANEHQIAAADIFYITLKLRYVHKIQQFFGYYPQLARLGFKIEYLPRMLANQQFNAICNIIFRYSDLILRRDTTPAKIFRYITSKRTPAEVETYLSDVLFKDNEITPVPSIATAGLFGVGLTSLVMPEASESSSTLSEVYDYAS